MQLEVCKIHALSFLVMVLKLRAKEILPQARASFWKIQAEPRLDPASPITKAK